MSNVKTTSIKGPSAAAPTIELPVLALPAEGESIRRRLEAMAVMGWNDLSMKEIHALSDRCVELEHEAMHGPLAQAYVIMLNGFLRLAEVARPQWLEELDEQIAVWTQRRQRKEARINARRSQAWGRIFKALSTRPRSRSSKLRTWSRTFKALQCKKNAL